MSQYKTSPFLESISFVILVLQRDQATHFNVMEKCSVSETITTASLVDIDSSAFFCWHSTRRWAENRNGFYDLIRFEKRNFSGADLISPFHLRDEDNNATMVSRNATVLRCSLSIALKFWKRMNWISILSKMLCVVCKPNIGQLAEFACVQNRFNSSESAWFHWIDARDTCFVEKTRWANQNGGKEKIYKNCCFSRNYRCLPDFIS